MTPVGTFIEPARVVVPQNTRERILYINPSPEKGAGVVAQLALMLEKTRPDIRFEVVESRGDWQGMVRKVIGGLNAKDNGRFINNDGKDYPW